MALTLPVAYRATLNPETTEQAIKMLKDTFQRRTGTGVAPASGDGTLVCAFGHGYQRRPERNRTGRDLPH